MIARDQIQYYFHSFVEAFSVFLTLSCLGFVVYQGGNCWTKYLNQPKSTDVRIENASKNLYPSLTICPPKVNGKQAYEEKLRKCNLTSHDYRFKEKWVGMGPEPYCNNSIELFETIEMSLRSRCHSLVSLEL